jgi:hypothetical protein
MNVTEYQNNIIRQVLLINEEEKLNEIDHLVKKLRVISFSDDENTAEKDIMEFKTFEEWDAYLQSKDFKEPDEFLPEWNMTSYDFRRFIWDAEHSGKYIPVEQFYEKLSEL